MKRLIRCFSAILALVLVISTLAGCGGGTTPAASSPAKSSPAVSSPAAYSPAAQKKATFPTKNSLEIIVPNNPGGGQDTMLRAVAKAITDNKIIDLPLNIVYKPGGNFMTGMAYLKEHEGDGHYLMGTATMLYMTPLLTKANISYRDFTPIACFGMDPLIVLTYAGSGFKTFKDVVDYKGVINVGATGTGSAEHMASYLMKQKAGININYIPFASDAEVATGLLGKQVQLVVTGPAAVMDYIKTGKFVPLAFSSPVKSTYNKDIPTFKELGYDIDLCVFRAVLAAGKIPDEAVQYWANALEKATKSDTFKKNYLEPNLIEPVWMGPKEFGKFQEEKAAQFETMMKELGLLK